ncbi:FtsX-like permease family protein [Fibrobacter intestinalis]|uniref:Lipoprotein-releasing system permease protein n=1 Tax=Fibrobacter intestinalis TaxID=28122 RepID=A0A1T4NYS0_9BACT|nr:MULTISPECIES: FtsX-like permease family protein [Fibrobacter]PBC72726.1 lipoprotein-releasing system permease protein [Fibrobacter sp. NR9]SJZ84176.1 lipoprotein-releasing system permease protein [Fibrobacter intestinalis]
MNKLELLIAWRYLGAQRKSLFVSLIGIFSMLGVSIGVFALIVALSAVNGFEKEVTAQMIGKDAHFELYAYRSEPVADFDSLALLVQENDSAVVASAPFIIYKVGISSKKVNDGVVLYGIDTERSAKVVNLHENIVSGNYSLDSLPDAMGEKRPAVILGVSLANRLRVLVGDKIIIQTFQSTDAMSSGGPKILSCVVSGIFETGMYEYDGNIAYIGISEAQRLLGMRDNEVSGVQFRVQDQWKANESAERAGEVVGYPYYFLDWKTKNITLLKWMNYEKFIVAAIICLIILVAAFNIISSLIMVVTDKTKEIGILRSMGLSKAGVMRVFMLMGSFIGVGGTIFGGSVGLVLCALQQAYHFIKLPGDVYVLPYFPVLIDPMDVFVVFVLGILLCTLSTILPAWKASKLDPVGAIRHE